MLARREKNTRKKKTKNKNRVELAMFARGFNLIYKCSCFIVSYVAWAVLGEINITQNERASHRGRKKNYRK